MIFYDVEQNTEEWERLRIGIPTASEFHKFLTPTGMLSDQADGYVDLLIWELLSKRPARKTDPTYFMDNGKVSEWEAIQMYEMVTGRKTSNGGFCTTDDGHFGCSPDRFVEDDGLLEIKTPAPWNHVTNLFRKAPPPKYYPQMQGQMAVTGRKWNEWMSYNDELPPVILRLERDEPYIDRLKKKIELFRTRMDRKLQNLIDRGMLELPGVEKSGYGMYFE